MTNLIKQHQQLTDYLYTVLNGDIFDFNMMIDVFQPQPHCKSSSSITDA